MPPRHCLPCVVQEERSSGTGRHLWVELPLPQQDKYEPEKVAAQLAELEEERQARRRPGKASREGRDSYPSNLQVKGTHRDSTGVL